MIEEATREDKGLAEANPVVSNISKENPVARMEFMQEGEHVVFYPKLGMSGWDIQSYHFIDCCASEASAGACIVKTASLQEMGFSLKM